MWKWKRRSEALSLAAFSFSHAKRISAVLRPNFALSPVDAGLLRDPDDVVDLRELLHDDDDPLAELAAEERQADVVVVLVAVADDEARRALVHRERDHELGLGARLEPVVVGPAGADDLVNDLAQLVHLDREDAAVLALVALVLDRLAEHLVELDDPVAEQVLEADDHGRLQSHPQGLGDDVQDADPAPVGEGLDVHKPLRVNREVAGAPALEPVVLLGFRCRPGGC